MVRIAVAVLVLAGCKDECADARKAATASVDEALSDSIRDGELLANLIDGPRLQAEVVRDARDELEPSLVTLAEHLNCKRFATLDATAKSYVQSPPPPGSA